MMCAPFLMKRLCHVFMYCRGRLIRVQVGNHMPRVGCQIPGVDSHSHCVGFHSPHVGVISVKALKGVLGTACGKAFKIVSLCSALLQFSRSTRKNCKKIRFKFYFPAPLDKTLLR